MTLLDTLIIPGLAGAFAMLIFLVLRRLATAADERDWIIQEQLRQQREMNIILANHLELPKPKRDDVAIGLGDDGELIYKAKRS